MTAAPAAWSVAVSALSGGTDRVRLPGTAPAWMEPAADPSGDLLARLGWLGTTAAVTPVPADAFEAFEPADAHGATPPRFPGPAASARLPALLPEHGVASPFLPEWLRLAEARGLAAPPEMIPELLVRPTGSVPAAVAGPWAGWAAWVVGTLSGDAESDVPEAKADRRSAYAAWLASEPDEGRAGLLDGFPTKPADVRADIVAAFDGHAVPEDEPFLDGCLDDRSERVREAAAHVLAHLEGSGYGIRMARLARGSLRLAPDGHGGSRLSLTAPPIGPANERDGVRDDGIRALRDIVPAVPPTALGHAPADLLGAIAAEGGGIMVLLLHGLAASACRWRDPAWAEAVAAVCIPSADDYDQQGATVLADALAACWGVMPPDRVAAQVMSLGGPEGPRHGAFALRALTRFARTDPLPPGVSRIVVRWALQREGYVDREDAARLAMACEPDESTFMLARAASDRAKAQSSHHTPSTIIADTLGLRLAMHREFDK